MIRFSMHTEKSYLMWLFGTRFRILSSFSFVNYDMSYRAERWNIFICKSVEYEMGNKGVWSQLLSQMVPYGCNQAEHGGF